MWTMVGHHMPRQKSSEMQSRLFLWREQGEERSRETGGLWTGASFPQNVQLLPRSHDSTFQDSFQRLQSLLRKNWLLPLCLTGKTHYFAMHLKVPTIAIWGVCNNVFWFGDHLYEYLIDGELGVARAKSFSCWVYTSLSPVLKNRPGAFLNPRVPWYSFIFHIELKKLTKGPGDGMREEWSTVSLSWRRLLVLSIFWAFKGSSLLPGGSDWGCRAEW